MANGDFYYTCMHRHICCVHKHIGGIIFLRGRPIENRFFMDHSIFSNSFSISPWVIKLTILMGFLLSVRLKAKWNIDNFWFMRFISPYHIENCQLRFYVRFYFVLVEKDNNLLLFFLLYIRFYFWCGTKTTLWWKRKGKKSYGCCCCCRRHRRHHPSDLLHVHISVSIYFHEKIENQLVKKDDVDKF